MNQTTTMLADGTKVRRCLACPACDDFSDGALKPFRPDEKTVAILLTWDASGRCRHCAHRAQHGGNLEADR